MIDFVWRETPAPAELPVRHVHGWLIDAAGRALIQERPHEGRYLLAGGTREATDTDWAATLIREAFEESQVRLDIGRIIYLGHQVVTGDPVATGPYVQIRLCGLIAEFHPVAPDPDNGHTYRRLLTSINRASNLLGWGTPGQLQAKAAARAARTMGLPVDNPGHEIYLDSRG